MPNPNLKKEKNNQIHQDSQGILTQTKANQDPQGILTESKPILISSKEYKHIKLEDITPYAGILDYIEPKPSAFPTIIKTPTRYFCIDGQYQVDEATAKKEATIFSHVISIDTESELEIAIRKATIRSVSDEGVPTFAELVRNCKKLLEIFLTTTENPVFYSHGGKRKGIQYDPSNRESNIRMLLAERFGKSVSTINKYINYGEYLNGETLNTIVESNIGKKFFEASASNKRRLIKKSKSEERNDIFITRKVSEYMAHWLQEWCEDDKKKIAPISFESNPIPTKSRCLIDLPTFFNHHGEINTIEEDISEQTLRQDIQRVGLEIYTNLNNDEFGSSETVEKLKQDISQALALTNKLSVITEVHNGNSC